MRAPPLAIAVAVAVSQLAAPSARAAAQDPAVTGDTLIETVTVKDAGTVAVSGVRVGLDRSSPTVRLTAPTPRPWTTTPASGAFTLTLVATLGDGSTLRSARPLRACRRGGRRP